MCYKSCKNIIFVSVQIGLVLTRKRINVDKYAYVTSRDEIQANDYNLNIPRYINTFTEKETVDIDEVKQNISNIEVERVEAQTQMVK